MLVSRSGAVAHHIEEEWQVLQASCEMARVERCNTSERLDVVRATALARGGLRLSGVWHAAGVLADGMLPKQSAQTLARVYGPKAHGGWLLQLAVAADPLHNSVLFSSVAALLGGAGQANYCAANASLDALASHRRKHGGASVSVQWGAWAEVGMAARGAASERMVAMEAAVGFGRLSVAHGLGALHLAVQPCAPSPLGVMLVQWHRMLGGAGRVPAFLLDMAPRSTSVSSFTPAVAARQSACDVSLAAVIELVQLTAGSPIDADAPLMEAGVDSLGAVEHADV